MAKKKPSKKQLRDQRDVAEDQWNRYVRARDYGHLQYVELAKKCSDFYRGEQWDAAVRKKLEEVGKPVLTINMVLSAVNAVLGEQSSKRVEFKYKPRNSGTEDSSMVLSKLIATIKDANQYDWLESQVFSDGVIEHGRGFFDVRMSWEDNIHGDIVITADDPRTTILDPDAKEYDPSTWKEVFDTRWLSLDDIEALYGQDKADELRSIGTNGERFSADSILWDKEETFGTARDSEVSNIYPIGEGGSEADAKTIRSVRVLSRQHVRLTTMRKFVDKVTGDMSVIPDNWDDEKIAQFAAELQLGVIEYQCKRIRWTTTADKIVLKDDWSPYKTFTKIPYFCYFRRGKPFGLVSNLISPQEQLNKLNSQELHILNTTANSGWLLERGSLVGMTADDLRNQGSEDGLVLEFSRGTTPPVKIVPNQPPTGIERAAIKSAQFIKEISGVNEAMLGTDSPEVSGVALEQKQFRGQVQMQVPFDNLQRTRWFMSRKLVELVQQFYTEERVFRITTDGINFEDEANQQFVINHKTASGEIINDLTIGKYEVVLSTVPARDSYDDSQFAEALNMRNIGITIPDDRIIEYSHLARKAELAEEVRQITGRGKMTEEQQAQMQWQQEMQMRLMNAEVMQAEAQVTVLEAEAIKLQAEAATAGMSEGGADNSREAELKLEELQTKITNAREQLQLRRDMARMSAESTIRAKQLDIKGQLAQIKLSESEKRKTTMMSNDQNNEAKLRIALLTGAQKAKADIAKEKAKPRPKPTFTAKKR